MDLKNIINTYIFGSRQPEEYENYGLFSLAKFWGTIINFLADLVIFLSITVGITDLTARVMDTLVFYPNIKCPDEDESQLLEVNYKDIQKNISNLGISNFDMGFSLLKLLNNQHVFKPSVLGTSTKLALVYSVAEMGTADGAYKVSQIAEDLFSEDEQLYVLRIAESKGSVKAKREIRKLIGSDTTSSKSGWLLAGLAIGIVMM